MRALIALAGSLALAACVSPSREGSLPTPPTRPVSSGQVPPTLPLPPPPVAGFRAPEVMRAPGLEAVIRNDRANLLRRFGTPRLDVVEGDMRKLQFSSEACVLDIFLYPLAAGGEPVATWVEARRRSDGAAVDRAGCVSALARR
jgi:hypothetical protein